MSLTLMTVVIVVGLTEASSLTGGKGVQMRPVIAGFILGLLLFVFDTVNQQLSRAFCFLIIIAALIYNGNHIANYLSVKTAKPKNGNPNKQPKGVPNGSQMGKF